MSKATMVIEGFAAEPRMRVSQSGKQMLDISVAHSPRRFNKQSNQWEDVLDRDGQKVTLWVRATFFEDMANYLQSVVTKGTMVRLEGEPRLNVYEDNGGRPAANLELQWAALSIVPRPPRPDAPQGGYSAPGGAGMSEWSPQPTNGAQSGFGDFTAADTNPF